VQLLLLGLLAAVGSFLWMPPGAMWTALGAALLAPAALVAMVQSVRVRRWLGGLVARVLGQPLYGFYASWKLLCGERRSRLGAHVVLMAARLLISVGFTYCILLSFGVSIPILPWTGIVCAAVLTTCIPISIWGIGTVEAVVVFGLGQFGVGSDFGLSTCLVWRALHIGVLMAWLGLYALVRTRDVLVVTEPSGSDSQPGGRSAPAMACHPVARSDH
jgi:uncharacterized membrane protein YbhN (UPF0104 family)